MLLHKIPKEVAKQAKIGLEMRKKHGRGGTAVGLRRANQLATQEAVSDKDILEIYAYHRRHEVDKRKWSFFDTENPSNGRIAWQLWGSSDKDEALLWTRRIRKKIREKNKKP